MPASVLVYVSTYTRISSALQDALTITGDGDLPDVVTTLTLVGRLSDITLLKS